LVVLGGVDGEAAEESAIVGDDSHVEVGDEEQHPGAGVGATEADVEEFVAVAEGDAPGLVDPVSADSMVALEWRERTRLYKSLIDQRAVWVQRIHAELYQHGVALPEEHIRSENTRQLLSGTDVQVSGAARQRIRVGYRMIDAIQFEAEALQDQITRFGRKQNACRALIDQIYGFGPTAAVVVWSELGDCQRFARSRQVVRHTGLDVTVDASDKHRGGGYLSRQGPGPLRWALFEAGLCASRATSPDRDYYRSVKERADGKLAAICVARKLARRSYHILRSMNPDEVYAIPDT
jgi:transposase